MTARRTYILLVGAIILSCFGVLIGAFYLNKTLVAKSEQLTKLKAKSIALERERTNLKNASKDLDTYTELQQITQSIVPEDKSQAQAVREIVNIANVHGVKLASITFPASSLGATASSASSNTTSASASSSATSLKKARLSQLTPVKNISGVYVLPITIQSDKNQPVRYEKFLSFLGALEKNRRTAQVSSITLDPSKDNRDYLGFTLTLNNYIRP